MFSRRFLLTVIIILLLYSVFKPVATWQEARRIWSQRDYILRVLVTVIAVYFLYGLFQLWARHGYPLP